MIELEDIMPYVFWWDNRGSENNGPTANCYGVVGSAKLNYQTGGWCYSSPQDKLKLVTTLDSEGKSDSHYENEIINEEKWHAV